MIERDKSYLFTWVTLSPYRMEQMQQKKDVLKSGITVVQVPRGVDFGNESNPQVATVLFGIAGIGNEHLEIIQKISIFCADVDNVLKLADAQSEEEVLRLLDDVE